MNHSQWHKLQIFNPNWLFAQIQENEVEPQLACKYCEKKKNLDQLLSKFSILKFFVSQKKKKKENLILP